MALLVDQQSLKQNYVSCPYSFQAIANWISKPEYNQSLVRVGASFL